MQITEMIPLEKGRITVKTDEGTEWILYRGEVRKLALHEGDTVSEELCHSIMGVIGVRAKKRAMHLLEKMDRTEKQLHDKLCQSGYPEECVADAIEYVRQYHYIDDLRYARTYIRWHQGKKSRQRLKTDLLSKGVSRPLIDEALEEEFISDEREQIRTLLEKRHFDYEGHDAKELQRTYQFLMRRGFKSSDILSVMKCRDAFED